MIGAPATLAWEARPPSAHQVRLARATLGLLFGVTLFYPLILGIALPLAAWYWPLATGALIAMALSSLWWARRASVTVKSRVLDAWRSYFSLRVWREDAPWSSPSLLNGPVLFVAVPHGLFPMVLPLLSRSPYPDMVSTSVYPELANRPGGIAGVASVFFWIPFLAPLVTWLGGVPATRSTLQGLLRDNHYCMLFPDGIAGAFGAIDSTGKSDVLRIAKRETSVLSLAHGGGGGSANTATTIVPVYCFGHTQLWRWSWPPAGHWLERLSRRVRMAFIWYWPLIPQGRIDVVFGAPLDGAPAHTGSISAAIAALYARHAERLGYGHRDLRIVE